MPLAKTAGLPNLKGAKIKIIPGDHQGKPEVGMAEAERLITQEKVVAIIGCYNSAVTATASQAAERYGIPFLNDSSSSPSLTERGFKWFFRTTPHDDMFSENFFIFLNDLRRRRKLPWGQSRSFMKTRCSVRTPANTRKCTQREMGTKSAAPCLIPPRVPS